MWESGVSVGCIVMYGLWAGAIVAVAAGWGLGVWEIGQAGIVFAALAAALTVIRDNQRTRRMLRRKDEVLAPMRKP